MKKALVIFGSISDKNIYGEIADCLARLRIDYDLRVSSAHKTPQDVDKTLEKDYSVVIAGAGLAAHLPGVVASKIIRPVIGVPCEGSYEGLDALLSIAQMPPGIPVLAVGVNKAKIAAQNCAKIMEGHDTVTIIGDKDCIAAKKAQDTLKNFDIIPMFGDEPNPKSVNIEFTYFDEPVEKKDELVIYCPLIFREDDKAEAALNFLRHTDHGLWVGVNNGVNAAIAAVEILNLSNKYERGLIKYRREIGEKILESNKK